MRGQPLIGGGAGHPRGQNRLLMPTTPSPAVTGQKGLAGQAHDAITAPAYAEMNHDPWKWKNSPLTRRTKQNLSGLLFLSIQNW